jgi:hypothetical protein
MRTIRNGFWRDSFAIWWTLTKGMVAPSYLLLIEALSTPPCDGMWPPIEDGPILQLLR